MTPCNETNNCSEIISGKCVKWSGELSLNCVTIPDCPKPSLEDVILAVEEKACTLNSTIGTLSGITMDCAVLPSPVPDLTKVDNHLQLIYDNLGFQKIDYNTEHFTVSGSTDCDKVLNIKYGEWVDITADVTFYNSFTSSKIEYMIEPATNRVHLRGTISRSSLIDLTSGSWSYSGSGNSLVILDLPLFLSPATNYTYINVTPGFNNSYSFSQGSAVTTYYSLQWNTAIFKSSNVTRISAYVPYGATQDGGQSSKTLSFYLNSFHYTLQ